MLNLSMIQQGKPSSRSGEQCPTRETRELVSGTISESQLIVYELPPRETDTEHLSYSIISAKSISAAEPFT